MHSKSNCLHLLPQAPNLPHSLRPLAITSLFSKSMIFFFEATWMELETLILILKDVSQKEKGKYHMISLISRIEYTAQMNLSTEKKIMICIILKNYILGAYD